MMGGGGQGGPQHTWIASTAMGPHGYNLPKMHTLESRLFLKSATNNSA